MDYDIGDEEDEDEEASWWFSTRLCIATMAFFGCMSMTSQRVCMHVAMICMVNYTDAAMPSFAASTDVTIHNFTASDDVNDSVIYLVSTYNNSMISTTESTDFLDKKSINELCGPRPDIFPENLTLGPMKDGEFDWTEDQQDIVYRCFFWGFIISQFPSGYLATRYGGRLVFGFLGLLASASTVLVPLAARTHYLVLILVRFIGGVAAGCAFPALHAVWGRWAPPEERTQLASIPFAGAMLGHVVTYPASAVLCHYGFMGGWPSIFYFLGGLGVVWSILWLLFMSDNPMTHPRISEREKLYILDSLSGYTEFSVSKESRTPWLKFVTSLPFLCLIICTFCFEWSFYIYEISIPRFMWKIIKFDLRKDPVIYALPYVGLWFMILIAALWTDKLHTRAFIPLGRIRKAMHGVGTLLPAALIVGLGFLQCHHADIAVALHVSAMSITGFQFSSFLTSYLDIAPRYAGILLGIANTLGMLANLACPVLLRFLNTQDTPMQWQMVFFIAAGFLAFSGFCFILCGSGEIEEWALCEEEDFDSEYESDYTNEYSDTEYDPESEPEGDLVTEPESTPSTPAAPSSKTRVYLDVHPDGKRESLDRNKRPRTPKSPRYSDALRRRARKLSSTKRPSVDVEMQDRKKSRKKKKVPTATLR